MPTVFSLLLSCLAFGVLFIVVETISQRTSWLTPDDSRKTVHIVSGLIAASLPFWLSFSQISALGLFFIGFMAMSKKTHLFPSIHGVERISLGEVYYPLALALVAWWFPDPVVYRYAVLVLALSDGFAAVVGMHVRGHRYRALGGEKSLEGSTTCWLITFTITVVTLSATGQPLSTLVLVSIGSASVITAVEAALCRGLDNLALPLLAALIISLTL